MARMAGPVPHRAWAPGLVAGLTDTSAIGPRRFYRIRWLDGVRARWDEPMDGYPQPVRLFPERGTDRSAETLPFVMSTNRHLPAMRLPRGRCIFGGESL